MTVGRDPEDLREVTASPPEGRSRGQASRFPAAMALWVAATMAVVAVPYAVNLAAGQGVPGPRAPRSQHFGASADVRTASAVAPTAPKSSSTKQTKGTSRSKPPETTVSAAAGDAYWVQIGAFRDAETAKRVAQRLREQKYRVHESTVTIRPAVASERAAASTGAAVTKDRDRYEVVVTGASASEVEATLTAKGLTSRAAMEGGAGAVITPGLPLGEAVALSQDLSRDGLAVRVQRVEAAAAAAPRAQGRAGDVVLHRVRVGGFTDRAVAEAALKELAARGYDPVLTRGSE